MFYRSLIHVRTWNPATVIFLCTSPKGDFEIANWLLSFSLWLASCHSQTLWKIQKNALNHPICSNDSNVSIPINYHTQHIYTRIESHNNSQRVRKIPFGSYQQETMETPVICDIWKSSAHQPISVSKATSTPKFVDVATWWKSMGHRIALIF